MESQFSEREEKLGWSTPEQMVIELSRSEANMSQLREEEEAYRRQDHPGGKALFHRKKAG